MRGQPQLSVKWFEFYEHFNEGGIFRGKTLTGQEKMLTSAKVMTSWATFVWKSKIKQILYITGKFGHI